MKRLDEREFYLHLAIRETWSTRELERQFRTCLFERTVLGPPKVSPVVTQIHAEALNIFKDSYVVEFLNLPDGQPPEPPPRRKRGGKRLPNSSRMGNTRSRGRVGLAMCQGTGSLCLFVGLPPYRINADVQTLSFCPSTSIAALFGIQKEAVRSTNQVLTCAITKSFIRVTLF